MLFGLPLLYWGLWLAILILWMGRFVTSFLSIYLVSALHIDEGVVGAVVAMYGFGSIIGCLFGGTLSDRFGRQSMIVIGEIGAAAALLVVSLLVDPVALGAALFVYGAFASLPSPAIAAYIADVVPVERQQRAYVLQSWAINFGYAIGPIVANQLVKVSYSLMFYVEAAVMIAVTALLVAFFREVRHLGIAVPGPTAGGVASASSPVASTSASTSDQTDGPTVDRASDSTSAAPAPGSLRDNWRRVLTDWPFLAFSVLMFGYYLVYFQSTSGLPIAMTDLGMGLGDYSILLTINGFMLCALQIPAMRLFSRMGNSRVIVAGLAVTVIGYAVQTVAGSWAGFALAVVLWTLGELGTFPIATTIVASMAPAAARGTYQGVYNVLWSLSIALAPLIGGAVISRFGGRTLWIACTVALIVVTAGMRATKASRERAVARVMRESIAQNDAR
ncbi:MFS transporter [Bifidobacterium sp. MA2]|uniref:MFS transporter n=1 Tax=Bifidobacterium santillanense TaxID=2809028 RepID=A0ABS5UNY5_9BIFI|nr:MFS transporter [Bifidobacterium santillanense]MBT1172577.1 MFS transporter [Bifidobacterium santillanense]